MATAETEQSYLDNVSKQIIEVFDRILSELKARRDELLAQVDKMRDQFGPKNDSVLENIRGLEEMRAQIEKMTVKQNLAMKKQKESLADIDSEIEKLKIGLLDISNVKFNCSIDQLINQVKQFGNIIDGSTIQSEYRSKLTAVKVMEKHIPKGYTINLHVDFRKDILYVYSNGLYGNQFPVSVFNANDFSFIQEVGSEGKSASFFTAGEDFIYIGSDYHTGYNTNSRVALHKQSDYSFVKELTNLGGVCNIFNNSDNEIIMLVSSKQNCALHIYDRALNFEREVELIYSWPSTFGGIQTRSQLKDERLYILLNKQLLVFNKEGHNSQTIFETKGKTSILKNPTSFYISESDHIIVTDSATESIKFFTPEGDLFHTIGEKTVGSDLVIGANDVVVYRDNVIVACRTSHHYPQIRMY